MRLPHALLFAVDDPQIYKHTPTCMLPIHPCMRTRMCTHTHTHICAHVQACGSLGPAAFGDAHHAAATPPPLTQYEEWGSPDDSPVRDQQAQGENRRPAVLNSAAKLQVRLLCYNTAQQAVETGCTQPTQRTWGGLPRPARAGTGLHAAQLQEGAQQCTCALLANSCLWPGRALWGLPQAQLSHAHAHTQSTNPLSFNFWAHSLAASPPVGMPKKHPCGPTPSALQAACIDLKGSLDVTAAAHANFSFTSEIGALRMSTFEPATIPRTQ